MTSSIYAAIFLGKGYSENLHSVRNTGQKPTNCTEIVRRDSKTDPRTKIGDIGSVRVEFEKFYMKLSLVNDEEVLKLMKGKAYILSDSVLCVGKMREFLHTNEHWEHRLSWFKGTQQYRGELDGIDREPVEFE